MAKQTRGFCKYCGKEYTRGGMLRHLAACKDRAESIAGESGKTSVVILNWYCLESTRKITG